MTKRKVYGYLLVTFMLWGSLFVVTQFVLGKIPTFTVAMARYLLSYIVLSAAARGRQKETVEKGDRKYFFIVGFIGYFVAVDFQLLGTKYAGSSMASLINSLNPVFISVMAVFILRERLTKEKVAGLALSMIGVYLIIGHGASVSLPGILCSFIAVSGWALMSVISRKISGKYSSLTITRYAMLIAALCNIPTSLLEIGLTHSTVRVDLPAVLGLLYMGLVCTAFTIYAVEQKPIGASREHLLRLLPDSDTDVLPAGNSGVSRGADSVLRGGHVVYHCGCADQSFVEGAGGE